jgi:hypothetical protein
MNPLDPAHIATLRCTIAGRLESTDPQLARDIEDRLNLNHPILVEARKAKLDRALARLKDRFKDSKIPESAVRRLIDDLEAPIGGKLAELCVVLRLWARKRYGPAW